MPYAGRSIVDGIESGRADEGIADAPGLLDKEAPSPLNTRGLAGQIRGSGVARAHLRCTRRGGEREAASNARHQRTI